MISVEVGTDSDVVILEANQEHGPALIVDNGTVELRLPMAGRTVADQLAAIDKLLSTLSELRVAISEEAGTSPR